MYRIGEEEIAQVRRAVESGSLFRYGQAASGHSQMVASFEKRWSQTIGVEYSLLLSGGGTAALICGLVGLGIGPGDEVLVPAYTWMATALAVAAVGAIPVLCEVDETLAIDPCDIVRRAGPHTRAVIPVHMAGRPCDMTRVLDAARAHELKVLEDCCQSMGGSFAGRRLGSWGAAGAFSFNDFKILSCGEGGALVTDDRALFERALCYHDAGTGFREHGSQLEIELFAGQQYRASELMGAVMGAQVERLEGILRDLRRVRVRFEDELSTLPDLRLAPSNDRKGDCGVSVALQFDTEAQARAFAAARGVEGSLPIDSGKHVYYNWHALMQHRIGHCDAVNPFYHPLNRALRKEYSRAMCPQTLDILARTVYIALHPDWAEETIETRLAACRAAALTLVAIS